MSASLYDFSDEEIEQEYRRRRFDNINTLNAEDQLYEYLNHIRTTMLNELSLMPKSVKYWAGKYILTTLLAEVEYLGEAVRAIKSEQEADG